MNSANIFTIFEIKLGKVARMQHQDFLSHAEIVRIERAGPASQINDTVPTMHEETYIACNFGLN